MAPTLYLKPCNSPLATSWQSRQQKMATLNNNAVKISSTRRTEIIVARGMLSPRKFLQRRKKVNEVFKDELDEADQKNWRLLMRQIEERGCAVSVLKTKKLSNNGALPRDLVLGTLVRFKQLKKWNLVSQILEWLRTQSWWDFNEMDSLMLITAYGKQGNFNAAEKVLSYMKNMGYASNVVSHTALMEAYGRGARYNNAEAIFRRMQTSGPEPSAVTFQIILKILVEGNKFEEAEQVFEALLNEEKPPLKPDQKMFHMMIYMHKKAKNYEKARKLFALMIDLGVPQSTVTYNSLMSFETNYKEVSKIYDQMQRSGLKPDVISYALLINAYGKARREDEALAVFEEMLDAGVRPTQKAYNILLDAFAISGMVEQARKVFESMRRDRYTPDLCSYTTMLSAYVNASDMVGAEKFFIRIKQDGLEPNVITYGVLMKGYAKINNLEKMMETYEQMQLSGIKANQTIFTTIMDAYGKNNDFGSAVVWYKEMEQYGVPPDQKAKNILLSLAKTADEQKEANQVVGLAHSDDCGGDIDGISVTSRFVDEDEDDDIDDRDDQANKDGYDEAGEAEDRIRYSKEQGELIIFNGHDQKNREEQQSLQVVNL